MNGRLMAICAACLCGIAALTFNSLQRTSTADDKPDASQSEQDRWMAVKLASAQELLADLTRGDFQRMETDARRMQVLNFLEQWLSDADVARRSAYQGQLNAFEFATKELIRNAADENMDGALKAYIAVTKSCVHCHQVIRDTPND